ncbi:hypothetical protein OsJ_18087 [Oryza sativa Japonica Group]|uniref:Uncharacterized protein n=1 Tax=Oryza sativa subsp. japonica TaxID=39947 RepID=B9FNX2_ORYSJ|nr:hypothetical protein OsJ_18087 [Oryza sativa Japonica Group]
MQPSPLSPIHPLHLRLSHRSAQPTTTISSVPPLRSSHRFAPPPPTISSMPPPIQAVGTPAHTFAATYLHLAACLCVASSSSAKVAGLVVAKPVKPAASSTNVLLRIKRHRGQSKSHPPPIGGTETLLPTPPQNPPVPCHEQM